MNWIHEVNYLSSDSIIIIYWFYSIIKRWVHTYAYANYVNAYKIMSILLGYRVLIYLRMMIILSQNRFKEITWNETKYFQNCALTFTNIFIYLLWSVFLEYCNIAVEFPWLVNRGLVSFDLSNLWFTVPIPTLHCTLL